MATVMAGFQVLPNGKDMDTNGILPNVVKVVENSGLKHEVGPMETVVEGSTADVFTLLEKVQQVAVEEGASEVITNVKMHYCPEGLKIEDKKQ
ncbi:thiamine-binding protein [Bacillus shivajii]|uniref:thiamine-binding protein n=1 Tax=Bacillus shivajii TaxID=1983719 RepID=UPI001CFB9295|nr:thiamine-binding protein [Bacillus shivajii]UCZ53130.1 thiamine-binding protein [Bacillus shivajii]